MKIGRKTKGGGKYKRSFLLVSTFLLVVLAVTVYISLYDYEWSTWYNIYQQVFLVFFAILYGVMLQSLRDYEPFPLTKRGKWERTILSILVLNIIPFIYFLVFFVFLNWYHVHVRLLLRGLILSIIGGIAVFGPYRLYAAIAASDLNPEIEKDDQERLFGDRRQGIEKRFKIPWFNKGKARERFKEIKRRNFIAGLFYFLIPGVPALIQFLLKVIDC